MISIIAYLVAYDYDTEAIMYITREVLLDAVPHNSTACILDIVGACNEYQEDDSIKYVDMYGYSYQGVDTLWEVDNAAILPAGKLQKGVD